MFKKLLPNYLGSSQMYLWASWIYIIRALTAVQVALLTIYNMCKAVDRGMVMGDIKLLKKSREWKAS